MSNGGFQNFFHLITGLPGGFGAGGTIPAALLATLAGAGALTAGMSGLAAIAAVVGGQGELDGSLVDGTIAPVLGAGLLWPNDPARGLAFTTSGRVALGRGRRAAVTRVSGPRRPTRP